MRTFVLSSILPGTSRRSRDIFSSGFFRTGGVEISKTISVILYYIHTVQNAMKVFHFSIGWLKIIFAVFLVNFK